MQDVEYLAALAPPRLERMGLEVGIAESLRETTEHQAVVEISLRPTIVDEGIEHSGYAVASAQAVNIDSESQSSARAWTGDLGCCS